MAKLRMPRERVETMLANRIRAGEDVAAKVKVAETTGGYSDWLDLFAVWRNDTITEIKAAYEGNEIALEFEVATETTEHSSPGFTFEYRKAAVRSGILQLERQIGRANV